MGIIKVKKAYATRVTETAEALGLSSATVNSIITAYIEDMRNSLLAHECVNIPGIFSITVIDMPNGEVDIRGAVSTKLRKDIRTNGGNRYDGKNP